ncbi:zinc finger protein 532-like [Tubulanus polymorphus]|uniref:zinc finger protein 532-like n=1 Tax=Tubulanus polymorphus TaxID=672921 RepID=UPI003DA6CA10
MSQYKQLKPKSTVTGLSKNSQFPFDECDSSRRIHHLTKNTSGTIILNKQPELAAKRNRSLSADCTVPATKMTSSGNKSQPYRAILPTPNVVRHMPAVIKTITPETTDSNGKTIWQQGFLKKANCIKRYKPPLAVAFQLPDQTFYQCEACNDSFMFHSSYASHVERKSVNINFVCSHCPMDKMQHKFPNKCALWLHLMGHVVSQKTAANDMMWLDSVNMSMIALEYVRAPFLAKDAKEIDKFLNMATSTKDSLPKDFSSAEAMTRSGNVDSAGDNGSDEISIRNEKACDGKIFQKSLESKSDSISNNHVVLGAIDGEPCIDNRNASNANMITSTQLPPSSTTNKTLSTYTGNDQLLSCKLPQCGIVGISWDCPECLISIPTKEGLAKHFSTKDATYKGNCDVCYLMMPNKCSFAAHKRTHKFTPPYVCPECGKQLLSLSLFKRHLTAKCFHNCRLMWLSCPKCPSSGFSNTFLLKTHFQMHHRDLFYRCTQCPVAFTTWDGISKHSIDVHKVSANLGFISKQVYQCHFCKICFGDNVMFIEHLENHIDATFKYSIPKYKCQICCELFLLPSDLVQHLMAHNNRRHQVVPFMCDYCGHPCDNLASEINHETQNHQTYIRNFFLNVQKRGLIKVNDPLENKKNGANVTSEVNMSADVTGGNGNKSALSTKISSSVPKNDNNPFSDLLNPDVVIKQEVPDSQCDCGGLDRTGPIISSDDRNEVLKALEKQLKQEVVEVREKIRNMQHVCKFCEMGFEIEDELISHRCPNDHHEISTDAFEDLPARNADVTTTVPIADELTSGLRAAYMLLHYHVCKTCKKSFNCKQDLEEHLTEAHGFSIGCQFSCLLCGLTYASIEDLNRHDKNVHQRQKEHSFYCTLCKEQNIAKSYKHKVYLINHLNKVHKVNRNKELWAEMKKQVEEMELQVYGKCVRLEEDGSSQSEESDANTSKRPSVSIPQEEETPALKRLRLEGGNSYHCAKCSYSSEDHNQFLDHIKMHKIEEDSFQCSECGVCFSVIPSLKRHLIIVHKVRNISRYVGSLESKQKANLYDSTLYFKLDSSKKKTEASPKRTQDEFTVLQNGWLECQVCYKAFNDMPLLKSHMRTHGMAFIQSKRIQALP